MYLFYIDECGRPSLDDKSLNDDPWFVMTAVGVHCDHWLAIEKEILRLKRLFFPGISPTDFEIKSTNIRSAGGKYPVYPFDTIPLPELSNFVEGLYTIYHNYTLPILSVVIDRLSHKTKYLDQGKRPEFPYQLAFKMLIERIDWFLANINENRIESEKEFAFVILDEYVGQYKVSRENLLWYQLRGTGAKNGIDYIKEVPFFNDSRYSQLLMLPDLPAYNIYHAFKYKKPQYPFFTRQLPLYYQKSGKVLGYGIKVFPNDIKNPAKDFLAGRDFEGGR